MRCTVLHKPNCLLPSTHQKLQVSCTEMFSVFSSKMKSLFPIWRHFPLAKSGSLQRKWRHQRLPHHIKQVTSDPQVAQVNLMRHQRTDLPPSKSKQKQHSHKSRSKGQKRYSSEHKNQGPPYKKRFDPSQAHQRKDKCSMCGNSKHIEGLSVLQRSSSARPAVNMVILQACAIRKNIFQV